MIYLALADVTACFCFPRISADVAGAFGFVAEGKYFVSTSMVFGSNISANAWDALRRGIQNTIPTLSQRTDLVKVHEELISQLRWAEENSSRTELVQAFPCAINRGVIDEAGNLLPMKANVYLDHILMAAVSLQTF